MALKKEPYIVTRRCVFCRSVRPLDELIRIARLESGVIIDRNKKAQGRGAYICKAEGCINGAEKSRALERSLKCKMPEGIYQRIAEEYLG